MPPFEDKTGHTYGDWTVLAFSHRDTNTRWWRVKCACGAERTQREWLLTTGKSKRCGACGSRVGAATLAQKQAEQWIGTETGGWVILAPAGTAQYGGQRVTMWTCRCLACGAVVDIPRTDIHKPIMPVCRHGGSPAADTPQED